MSTLVRVRNQVDLTGDHRSGKTEALIRIAVDDARQGRRVLYVADGWAVARNTAHRTRGLVAPEQLGAGAAELQLIGFGGGIAFVTGHSASAHRGIFCDTLILDDVHSYETNVESLLACTSASADPRVYTARLVEA